MIMKKRSPKLTTTHRVLSGLFGAAAMTVAAAPALCAEATEAAANPLPVQKPMAAPQIPAAGLSVYIDPQTGAILKEPAPATQPLQLSPEEQRAMSTSHDGLVEVPASVPGGGYKLDLQGRFMNSLIGTVDANGKIRIRHFDVDDKAHAHASPEK
jgi:hypothetical protein